jgi:predicted ATP-dependent endonuclease of OLD family
MKISKIKVSNYRLLKSFELDMEDDLSLVIGKNNCGKTSLLCILDKFIGKKSGTPAFSYDDFNLDFQKELETIYTTDKYQEIITELENADDNKWKNIGLSLKLFIEYTEVDSLANVSKLMMDLDPDNRTVVLLFEYILDEENFKKIKGDFHEYKLKKERKEEGEKKTAEQGSESEEDSSDDKFERRNTLFNEFMKRNSRNYFKTLKKSIAFDTITKQEDETEYINIVDEKISLLPIINFNIIPANREISNKDSDKTLSFLASEYYKRKEEAEQDSPEIKSFKDKLEETDVFLDSVYAGIFEKVVNKVELFGGIKKGDSIISINSTLQHRELLKGNTTVMYDHNEDCSLPENYNGLGYLNLISMIFDIELLVNDFRRGNNINEEPADINLLFIEEPEAHTHPQMQYVFIKNIKNILKEASEGKDENGVKKFQLQTLITSHSSHITSESKFDDIKYFFKIENKNEVIAKNLKDLKAIYGKAKADYFKFLKQYLTLHRSELFFADKAIFIEGDTERILLPAIMKKIDQEDKSKGDKSLPLLSQNISIIEVGAYSHIFEKFFDFIGLKSLIITDIDSAKDDRTKCRVCDANAKLTTNASLSFFHNGMNDLDYFKKLPFDWKILRKKKSNNWVSNRKGNLLAVYQVEENAYHARSFEDAFFHINRQFIIDNKDNFKSLKNILLFEDAANDSYDLADKCVGKKPSFAMEILLNSKDDEDKNEFSNWQIPAYIKEGLAWLKKN